MVALHVCQVWWTLTYKPLRSMRAHIIVLKTNRLGQVLFPFARWQDDHAETALCIRRTRTRTLCIRRTLCRHVTIGTPIVIFLLFDCFWLFLTIGTLLLHCWYSLDRPVTIGTPMVIFAVLTVFWLFLTIGTLVGKYWKCYNTPTDGSIGTKLGRSHPTNTSTAKPFPWYWSLLLTAQWTFWFYGVEIKNIHNVDETWMTLCHYTTKIKSGRKTTNINTKQPQKFYHC